MVRMQKAEVKNIQEFEVLETKLSLIEVVLSTSFFFFF